MKKEEEDEDEEGKEEEDLKEDKRGRLGAGPVTHFNRRGLHTMEKDTRIGDAGPDNMANHHPIQQRSASRTPALSDILRKCVKKSPISSDMSANNGGGGRSTLCPLKLIFKNKTAN